MAFDAFISYAHAADGGLAPSLQRALQRLAKPWYRPRALRVFRDASTLSANPHLWSAIRTALDESEWLILMASPAAVASDSVARELDHWLMHKSSDRILAVVTNGTWEWDANTRALNGTSVPPALRHAFDDEPRYADLRWVDRESELDLRDARFREVVTEIAAPVHGMARDDLDNDDLRQHRRAQRLARGGVTILALLTVVSLVVGTVAVFERRNAQEERRNARQERARAVELDRQRVHARLAASAVAESQRGNLHTGLLLAEYAARRTQALTERAALFTALETVKPRLVRYLATTGPDGDGAFDVSRDGRSVLIGGEAPDGATTLTHVALDGQRRLTIPPRGQLARLSDDRSRIVVRSGLYSYPRFSIYDTSSGALVWSGRERFGRAALPALDHDGRHAVFGDGRELRFLDVDTGRFRSVPIPRGVGGMEAAAFSPDGRRFAIAVTPVSATQILQFDTQTMRQIAPPSTGPASPEADVRLRYVSEHGALRLQSIWFNGGPTSVIVWDTSGRRVRRLAKPPGKWSVIDVDRNERRLLATDTGSRIAVLDARTHAVLASVDNLSLNYPNWWETPARFVGARDQYAAIVEQDNVALYDLDPTGTPSTVLTRIFRATPAQGAIYTASADGELLATAYGDIVNVVEPDSGRTLLAVVADGTAEFVAIAPNNEYIAIALADRVQQWNVRTGRPMATARLPGGATFCSGPDLLGPSHRLEYSPDSQTLVSQLVCLADDAIVAVSDVTTGRLRFRLGGPHRGETFAGFSGHSLVVVPTVDQPAAAPAPAVALVDLATGHRRAAGPKLENWPSADVVGTRVAATVGLGGAVEISDLLEHGKTVTLPAVSESGWFALSPDGATLATWEYDSGLQLWDVAGGTAIGTPVPVGRDLTPYLLTFTSDGDILFLAGPPPDLVTFSAHNAVLAYRIVARRDEWVRIAGRLVSGRLTRRQLTMYGSG